MELTFIKIATEEVKNPSEKKEAKTEYVQDYAHTCFYDPSREIQFPNEMIKKTSSE